MLQASLYGVSSSVGGDTNRVALEAATADGARLGEKVQLPDGVINVEVRPGSNQGYCVEWISGGVKLLAGSGGTTIRQVGSSAGFRNQLFRITGGSDYEFGEGGGLILDGGGVTGVTGDQNHLVEINTLKGPITSVKFHGVEFRHSGGYVAAPGAISTGDGLRTVGSLGDQKWKMRGLRLYSCKFTECGRSGLSTNRGTEDFLVEDCEFSLNSDQDYDTESSDNADITDGTFLRCSFGVSMVPGGPCISLGGAVNGPMRRILFEDCFMPAPINGAYLDGVTLRRCTIDPAKVPSTYASVSFLSRVKNVLIDDCDIWHYAENGQLAALLTYAQYNENPDGIRIVNSRIRQLANAHVIQAQSTNNLSIEGGSVSFDGPSSSVWYGLWIRTLGVPIAAARVKNVNFSGTATHKLLAAIGTTPDVGYTLGNTDFDGIGVENCTWALDTRNTAAEYGNRPALRGSRLGPGVGLVTQSSASAPTVILGGSRDKTTVKSLSRWGLPENTEPAVVGSTCVDRSTGFRYFKTTGISSPTKTGWVRIT